MSAKETRKRIRMGLLLGVFARRHLLAEAEKDGPASSILARGIVSSKCLEDARHPRPSHALAQWLPVLTGCGMQLPAYSGGTAWAFHPLRVTAGQSRQCDFTGSTSIVREYNMR
jgi:hypothetical protein